MLVRKYPVCSTVAQIGNRQLPGCSIKKEDPFFGFKPGTWMFSTFRKPPLLLPPAFFLPFLRGFFGGSGACPAKRLLFLGFAFGFALGFFVPAPVGEVLDLHSIRPVILGFRLIFALFKRPSWRRFSADPFILKGAPDHNGSGRTPKPR